MGEVVAWSRSNAGLLFVGSDGRQSTISSAELRGPLTAAFVDGHIEVVDTARSTVLQLARDGRLVRRVTVRPPVRIIAAARTAAGWFIGGIEDDSSFVVMRVMPDGKTPVVMRVPAVRQNVDNGPPDPGGVIAPYGTGVLVVRRTLSFRTVVLDSLGALVLSTDDSAVPSILASIPDDAVRRYWLTTGAVETDVGWLQIVSDLRSDTRLLVTFDKAGRVMRHRVLHAPFGIVASHPERRRLLAARTTRGSELVLYNWRWRAASKWTTT